MTDEKLDQILKQALTPEIDDSEIQVRRKGRKRRMTRKTVVASGLVACAVVAFVVTGGYFGIFSKSEGGELPLQVWNAVMPVRRTAGRSRKATTQVWNAVTSVR